MPENTLVREDARRSKQLVEDSIQVLDLDSQVDAMPGDSMKQAFKVSDGIKSRRSRRLDMLESISDTVNRTKRVWRNKSREVVQLSKDRLQDLNRRASLRPRESNTDEPIAKKHRIIEIANSKGTEISPDESGRYNAGPRVKRWLTQGLYVGQDRDFEARLTDSKNKMKKASSNSSESTRRSILPLPMFAGQRTMELGRDFLLPFDVFSPLPPGQPKPEEWRKIQKSQL